MFFMIFNTDFSPNFIIIVLVMTGSEDYISIELINSMKELKDTVDIESLCKHIRLMTSSIMLAEDRRLISDEMTLLLEVRELLDFLILLRDHE